MDRQKQEATGSLKSVADALHAAGDRLENDDQGTFAEYAHAAAEQVERFTQSIRTRSVGDILDEAQRFARREPAMFIGGAFLVGLVGVRFLKASEQRAGGRGSYGRTDMDSRGFQGRTGRMDYGRSMPRQGDTSTRHGRPLVSGTEGARIPEAGGEPAVRRTESQGAARDRGGSSSFGTAGVGTSGARGAGATTGGASERGTAGGRPAGKTGGGASGPGTMDRGDADSPSRNR